MGQSASSVQTPQERLFSGLEHDQGPGAVSKLQQLLRGNAHLAAVANDYGWKPLHFALWHQEGDNALAITKALLAVHAEAACNADKDGWLPLHLAAGRHGGVTGADLVEVLIAAAPHAALARNSDGSLPLHVAAQWQGKGRSVAVLEALLRAAPEAAMRGNCDGWLPLHVAAAHGQDEKAVMALLMAEPAAAHIACSKGCLPAHLAISSQGARKEEILRALVQAAPEALHTTNDSGDTLLHLACQSRALGLVQMLLDMDLDAAMLPGKDGGLPLHVAVAIYRIPIAIVQLLLRARPEAALLSDPRGCLALHRASAFTCSKDVLTALIKAAPQALLKQNEDGDAPLHVYGQGRLLNCENFLVLLDAAPQAVFYCNARGCWPRAIPHLTDGSEPKWLFPMLVRQAVTTLDQPESARVLAAALRYRVFMLLLAHDAQGSEDDGDQLVDPRVQTVFLYRLLHVIRRIFLANTFDPSWLK